MCPSFATSLPHMRHNWMLLGMQPPFWTMQRLSATLYVGKSSLAAQLVAILRKLQPCLLLELGLVLRCHRHTGRHVTPKSSPVGLGYHPTCATSRTCSQTNSLAGLSHRYLANLLPHLVLYRALLEVAHLRLTRLLHHHRRLMRLQTLEPVLKTLWSTADQLFH